MLYQGELRTKKKRKKSDLTLTPTIGLNSVVLCKVTWMERL